MRQLIILAAACLATLAVQALTVRCPQVQQLHKVFVGVSQSYYWQARVENMQFSSNIRRDRSEQVVKFMPQASHMHNAQPVCAYQMNLLRNNQLTARYLYLSGKAVAPLTPQQIQAQQQRAQARKVVSQGIMASRWVTPAARQNNSQPITVPPGHSVTGQPLPRYAPGHQ